MTSYQDSDEPESLNSAEQRHVLHVAQPTEQGVAIVVADYVSILVARGWRVTVACPEAGGLMANCADAGAEVIEWEAGRSPGPKVPVESLRLRRLVQSVAPDVVHLHSSKAGLAGRLAIRGSLPTVFSPHAWSFLHGGAAVRRAALAWERSAQRWTDRFVCGSSDELATGRRLGLTAPAVVVPNAVVISEAESIDQRGARGAVAPDFESEAPLVVCVGRLVHQKGQDVLLAAWPEIRKVVPNAQLALVGGGPEQDQYDSLVTPGVHIVGEVPRDDVLMWIRAADVVAAPSRWETLSLAVLEALALGRPVVAADVEGMREAVENGAGAIVPGEDPVALAAALIPYVNDRAFAAEQGERARINYQRRWSRQMDDNSDSLDRIYRQVVDGVAGINP